MLAGDDEDGPTLITCPPDRVAINLAPTPRALASLSLLSSTIPKVSVRAIYSTAHSLHPSAPMSGTKTQAPNERVSGPQGAR